MTMLLKKLLLTLTVLSAFTVMNFGLSAHKAKAETTDCMQIVSLPAVITVQGIYCFKTNLVTSITSGNAIEIQTNNVSIDMNGFKLGGASAGAGTQANGFFADGRKNITIKNGSIRGFYRGILLSGSSGSGHLIEHIRADGNTAFGFEVSGNNNIIRNNHIINTGPGTVLDQAHAISLNLVNNTLIADNVISGISESFTSSGINIFTSSRVKIRGNSIFDSKGVTTSYGILFALSSEVTIQNNQITNPSTATGSNGIYEGTTSTKISCKGNVVVGYTNANTGCDLDVGNHNF